MHLVVARSDRSEIEPPVAGREVAQRDVGPFGQMSGRPVGFDAAEPHARIVGGQEVEPRGAVVPRQSVQFGLRRSLPVLHTRLARDGETPVGRVFDPCQPAVGRRGVERMAPPAHGFGLAAVEIHVAELRVDPLLEERRTPVLRPPDPPVGVGRPRGDAARVGHGAFASRLRVDRNEARRAVVVGFEREDPLRVDGQRKGIGRVALHRLRREIARRIAPGGQGVPVVVQPVERLGEERTHVGAIEFFQRDRGGEDHVGVAGPVPRHLVPDVLAVARVGVGGDLVAQVVVIGHVGAVRAAEPAVDVAAAAHGVAEGAVLHGERRLQRTAERRHLRLHLHGVAFDEPDGQQQQSHGRTLLSEHVAQPLDDAAVEVVVLHGVAVFVRHELLVPRHRVAVDCGRGEELHALGQPHHQPVRAEVLGVHDERDFQRPVAESVADRGPRGLDEMERAPCDRAGRVGEDDLHVGGADRPPAQRGGVGPPAVILRPRDGRGEQQRCHEQRMSDGTCQVI